MRLVHDSLTKSQRALRAYLNLEIPPEVFRNRHLTHYHLSRYSYVKNLFNAFLNHMLTLPLATGHNGAKLITPELLEIHARFFTSENNSLIHFPNPSSSVAVKGKEHLKNKKRINETLVMINQFHREAMNTLQNNAEKFINLWSMPGNTEQLRMNLRASQIPSILQNFLENTVLKKCLPVDRPPTENEMFAFELLVAVYCHELWEKYHNFFNAGNRMHFNSSENSAWQELRWYSLKNNYNLTRKDLSEIVRRNFGPVSTAFELTLNRKFEHHGSKAYNFDFCDYLVDFGPFALKPLSRIKPLFGFAIYPGTDIGVDTCSEVNLNKMLSFISDPNFEHADGAIAIGGINIINGHVILEELQTDLIELAKRNKYYFQLNLPALKAMRSVLENWHTLGLTIARILGADFGVGEIYVATPFRIFQRYKATIHPEKAKYYFEKLEAAGGRLVYDDDSCIDSVNQYYYAFDTNTSHDR